ncbi:hypothetical protein BJF90_32355 [Pseudonocardia sp. CNS-004]|nr:hypothetical protein BJF90_32355 [Pseudonocardia sp. CNS-004]
MPRRATDRLEDVVAWLLMVAGLVLVIVAWSTGTAVYSANVESMSTLTQTRAMLLEDAKVVTSRETGVRVPVRVEARWVDRVGFERTGELQIKDSAPAGTEVEVWIGPDGEAADASLQRENAVTAGIVTGTGLLLVGAAVLGAAWYGVRLLTASCNARRWEREWARVGPHWH